MLTKLRLGQVVWLQEYSPRTTPPVHTADTADHNQLAVLLTRTLVGEGVERLEEIVLGQVGGAYLNHANVI